MENFEKCTVAMIGGPCSQHVTGNTSRLNQPQSAIICDMYSNKRVSQMWAPVAARREPVGSRTGRQACYMF